MDRPARLWQGCGPRAQPRTASGRPLGHDPITRTGRELALKTPITVQPEEVLGPITDIEHRAAPPELYLRGDRTLLEVGPRVAVVGSRRASAQALEWTRLITQELVSREVTVVSGLAMGIDTVAHRTALDAGGRTVAVLGTGLDQYAVSANRGLQEEIGRRGLLVSQFREGSAPNRSHFPRRNKTMALLSDATLVVEAGENSGTRHQGWEAIRLGRPVLFLRKFLGGDLDQLASRNGQVRRVRLRCQDAAARTGRAAVPRRRAE